MDKTIQHILKPFLLTSFGILLGTSVTSCDSKSKTPNTAISPEVQDPNLITLTAQQFQLGQMELGKISTQEFNTTIKANGSFAVPPENQADVSAYFAGYVKNISLLPGDYVKKGQTLFTIENPEYIQIQQNFLEAKGRLAYLKSDYERQKALMADNVTSQKSFLKAESDYEVTLAQFQALQKQLSLMHIDPNTLSGANMRSVIAVPSPLSGYITSIEASKGMYLNPSDVAMTVTNTDELHIELKIFEKDLPKVKMGQPINIRLQNDNEQIYKGSVHLINRAINEKERTIDIHGDLNNPEDAKLFAPGMYIEGEIVTASSKYPALPSDAISNIDKDYFVLVKENDTTFKKTPVSVGSSYNGYTQLLNADAFDPNTEFLVKGAFNLITE
ncbi:efflux RND transporter periplasmic adaptor subunit [Mangrovimonas xylaniphaga]|uniref:efflux RND transporter periplasmic adaptor subunit n=1 Tax=Mangrovimonas xylaniphaga TaxID=1645915 RepID=UPI0006B6594F|nr:efflux RND transporter periplasmic adaptor subunit [Mangrovimonas xylaniphaga]